MPNLIKEVTRTQLEGASLPNHGSSYTVVPHGDVISTVKSALKDNNFRIVQEHYRSTTKANVAQGVYYLYSNDDPDMGLMFAWSNSYDKSRRFKCALGTHVFVCGNGMLTGNMNNYSRKHTGTADQEMISAVNNQLINAALHFKNLVRDKNLMKTIMLDDKQQSEIVGRLFLKENLLSPSQTSVVKKEMEEPSHFYNADPNSLWSLYNNVTIALKQSHPRYWIEDHQKFHDFIMAEYASMLGQKFVDSVDQLELFAPVDEL